MVDIIPTISTLTFNVSGLNAPIKTQQLSEWIKKQKDKLHVVYKKFTLNIKVLCCAVLSHSVVSESLRPHGLQPARFPHPWGFSRQEYWSGLPCPPPGDLPNPGIEPRSATLQVNSLLSEPPGKPIKVHNLKVSGWRKRCNANLIKKAGGAILISDRAYFKARKVIIKQ